MATQTACRRRQGRHPVSPEKNARVEFRYPAAPGSLLSFALRDISLSGLSFTLSDELPGLEVGDLLTGISIHLGGRSVRGEVLVMHLTPDSRNGSICGGLFYPDGDENLLEYRSLFQEIAAST